MANPGTGFRSVNSVAIEISNHFVEPYVSTTLTSPVSAPGSQTISVASTVAMYIGAQIVCDVGASQEIIMLTAVGAGSITAVFANTHLSGAQLLAATFPTQQPTDPFFTQSEILGYLARAQNEFLARVPAILLLSQQQVNFGQIFQTTPTNCVEINRVAYSNPDVALVSLTRTSQIVAAVSATPHGLIIGDKFSILSATPVAFNGAFKVSATPLPTPTTFSYRQVLPDGSASTAGVLGLWTRLYERTQTQLDMQDSTWRNQSTNSPRSFFEDRAGNYKWGIANKPASNYPVELLCAIRDSDVLTLTDGFLVPDIMLHAAKYLAMSWMWDKDGEERDPKMASHCLQRFEGIVLATQRWIDGVLDKS